MKIIDNALSPQLFDFIKKQIFDYNFPWYYCDTSNDISKESIYGNSFSHLVLTDDKINSSVGHECRAALFTLADRMGVEIRSISRIRVGLLEPKPQLHYRNIPHIDSEIEHYVGLLYLNDSDGDTILYKEKYDPSEGLTESEYYDIILDRKVTEDVTITPKANKFIAFNGYYYHSSTCPSSVNRRVTLNFNFTTK